MSLCTICRHSNAKVLGPHPDFPGHNIVRCRACAMVSIDPQPSIDELAELYPESYRMELGQKPSDAYLAFMDKRATAQKAFISTHLQLDSESRVLDIGCSAGSFLLGFSADTPNLEGYEPDVVMAGLARDRLPASAQVFNELCDPATLPSARYDLIALSHVFEHLIDPVGFLGHLLRATRPGGLVFIEVPNEPVSEVMRQVRAPYRGKLHLSFFNPDSLRRCAERSDGTVVKIASYGPTAGRFSLVPEEMLQPWATRTLLTRVASKVKKALLPSLSPKWIGSVDLGEYLGKEDRAGGVWIRALFSRCVNYPSQRRNLDGNHGQKRTVRT
jgi:SAM-dependent methyltransferase